MIKMNGEEAAPPEGSSAAEHARRWRLILGKDATSQVQGQMQGFGADEGGDSQDGDGDADAEGTSNEDGADALSEEDQAIDDALDALYGQGGDGAGLGGSAPEIARWLGNIRDYFPGPVAQMLQREALKKVNLRRLLQDPDLLDAIEPDLEMVSQLVTLSKLLPAKTRESARMVVKQVVDELLAQLEYPLHQAIKGSLNRALRSRNPRRQRDVNWLHTIRANLKHYQVEQRTVIPETLIGYGRQDSSLRDVILCIDQSGSMARSVVYASIFGAVMASIPALTTRLVLFDTSVVDLTEKLSDPVDLLFGLQLRGGTNIDRALGYCQGLVSRPRDTILILISDLFEGGNKANMVKRVAALVDDGVQVIVLLALDDKGAPRFNRTLAQDLVDIGVPSFACTPQLFPDLMGAAINGRNLRQWAAEQGIVAAPSN